MTSADAVPEQSPDEPAGLARLDNGLFAGAYVPLTDLAPELVPPVLTALGRARIPAYVDASPAAAQRRLFVSADERSDARAVVTAAVRGVPGPDLTADPLAGVDTDAAFAALIADWHVDTIDAVRAAERDLTREDEDWRARLVPPAPEQEPVWLDEDHYIPPPPPPLPRLAAPTIGAMALLAVSIVLLGLGGAFGLATDLTMLLGVTGVLVGAWMLIMRLRERRDDDEDDDGAIV